MKKHIFISDFSSHLVNAIKAFTYIICGMGIPVMCWINRQKILSLDKIEITSLVGILGIITLSALSDGIWYMYHTFQFVWVDETGVTCKFLWKSLQHLEWKDIKEWGIGWQYRKPGFTKKHYRSLPLSERRFCRNRNKTRGDKYIYFSTQPLLEEEKGWLATERFRRKGLLLIRYSEEAYLKIFNMDKIGLYSGERKEERNEFKEKEMLERVNIKKIMICRVDIFEGVEEFIVMFLLGETIYFMIKIITGYNAALLWLVYSIWILWGVIKYLKKVVVSEKGITYYSKPFRKKIFWKWDEIYECAVFIDYFLIRSRYYDPYYTEKRYIYFTTQPFVYKTEGEPYYPDFDYYFKQEGIVMVRYSEELYWYLKKLGVLGIKDNNIETKS